MALNGNARYGGEEFALLSPDMDAAGCANVGNLLREALRDVALPHAENLSSKVVTVSVGGATALASEIGSELNQLVHRADRALYSAKDNGRDCFVMFAEASD